METGLQESLNAEEKVRKKMEFQKLTPTSSCERMESYIRAFHYIFSENDIQNVAISGPYGCGKSSVFETYKESEEGRKKAFVHISLAHFSRKADSAEAVTKGKAGDIDTDTDGSINESTESVTLERTIEGKIINQLIQQIPEKRIPQSNFRVKRVLRRKDYFFSALGITFFLCVLLYFLNFETMKTWLADISSERMRNIGLLFQTKKVQFVLMLLSIVFFVMVSINVFIFRQAAIF